MIRILAFWTVFALAATVPLATPAEVLFPVPIVVVYPFTVSGSSGTSQVGGNVALLLATRLGQLGGLTVKPFTPGTVRADYLTAARDENADYYVTGFLAPIGSEVSLITQVVTTTSGLVVWSSTITIRTYGDASAQADPLHQAILANAGRSLSAIPAQSAAATPQPATSDAASFNVTRALGHHRKDATVVASPAPSPTPGAPRAANAIPAAVPVASASPASAAPDAGQRANVPAVASAPTALASPPAVPSSPLPRTSRHPGSVAIAVAASPSAPPSAAPTVTAGTTATVPQVTPSSPSPSPSRGRGRHGQSAGIASVASPSASPAAVLATPASPGVAAHGSGSAVGVLSPGPPGAIVTDVGGPSDAPTRSYTGSALAAALRRAGVTRGGNVPIAGADAIAHAADLCRANAGARALYVPTVAVSGVGRRNVTIDIDAYDCAGNATGSQHDVETAWGRRALEHAIDRAAQKTVEAFLRAAASPPPKAES